MIDPTDPEFWPRLFDGLLVASGETLIMLVVTGLVTLIGGLALGVILVATDADGVLAAPCGSRALALRLHRGVEAGLVETEVAPAQDVFGEVHREPVGVVQLEDDVAG